MSRALAFVVAFLLATAALAQETPGAPPAALPDDVPKWKAWKQALEARMKPAGSMDLYTYWNDGPGGRNNLMEGWGEKCRIYVPIEGYRDVTPKSWRDMHRRRFTERVASLVEGLTAAQERGQLAVRLCDGRLLDLALAEMRYVDKYLRHLDGNVKQLEEMNVHMIRYYDQEHQLMLAPSRDCRNSVLVAKQHYASWTLGRFLGREAEFDGWLQHATQWERAVRYSTTGELPGPDRPAEEVLDAGLPPIIAELIARRMDLEAWNAELDAALAWIERNRPRIESNATRLIDAFDEKACVEVQCDPEPR